ncbi:MAG TPA: hypothetical protein VG298_15200 [Acidimicrobiales bacterium]|nr:hypothetical protein [Acidimicrobiales bacterium]
MAVIGGVVVLLATLLVNAGGSGGDTVRSSSPSMLSTPVVRSLAASALAQRKVAVVPPAAAATPVPTNPSAPTMLSTSVVRNLVSATLNRLKAVADAPAQPEPAAPIATLPARGTATQWGCAAALTYLRAYGAPGFALVCPGTDQGHQATTMCFSLSGRCAGGGLIIIADPCPAAYMNEASNSLVLSGLAEAPIDPYGECG